MSRFTAGFESQYTGGGRSAKSSRSGGGPKFSVNKLGSGGKLSGSDMASLRTLLAEKTSHGHQKQTINMRKTAIAARNVITPPWGANRNRQATKKNYKTPGVGTLGVTSVRVGQPVYHGGGTGPDITHVAKRRPGDIIQKENEDYARRLASQPQHYQPSYAPDMKKKLQNEYVHNLRAVSTVPNSLNHGDVGITDDSVSGRKRFEEENNSDQMASGLYTPMGVESTYVPPEMMATYNKQMDSRRPYA